MVYLSEHVYFELEGRLFEPDRLDEELGVASVVEPVVRVWVHLFRVESFMVLLSLLLIAVAASTPSTSATSLIPGLTAIARIMLITVILGSSGPRQLIFNWWFASCLGGSSGNTVGRAVDLLVVI